MNGAAIVARNVNKTISAGSWREVNQRDRGFFGLLVRERVLNVGEADRYRVHRHGADEAGEHGRAVEAAQAEIVACDIRLATARRSGVPRAPED